MQPDDNPLARATEYELETSATAPSVDGYRKGEPKTLRCPHCDVALRLTARPSVGLWSLQHDADCPNAGATPPE